MLNENYYLWTRERRTGLANVGPDSPQVRDCFRPEVSAFVFRLNAPPRAPIPQENSTGFYAAPDPSVSCSDRDPLIQSRGTATTMPNDNVSSDEPQSQDFLTEVGDVAERHKGNLLVQDLINLNCKLWLLSGRDASEHDDTALAKHLVSIIKNGCAYTLPSSTTATESFFEGTGRILKKEEEGDQVSWTEISDPAAVTLLAKLIHEELESLEKAGYGKEGETQEKPVENGEAESETDTEETPAEEGKTNRSDKRQKMNSGEATTPTVSKQPDKEAVCLVATKPSIEDVVLLEREDAAEKTHVDHAGNALLILELSQFFTEQYMLSKATTKGTRADAALATVYSLLGPVKDENAMEAYKTRFLLRPKGTVYSKKKDTQEVWKVLSYSKAAEFVLTLLFEKLVDKENIAAALDKPCPPAGPNDGPESPSKVGVKAFTNQDVLFGRGGLTNTHPGNRRFRDIILLHRPDYARAIKIEKPNVARRIVRAIRCGSPPGRFLKKDPTNGMWYDVGDRHAAEKTSQALREKTQAEKVSRYDDDKRKRLRDGGLAQLASQRSARLHPVLPLPTLTPAELQQMVQAQAPFFPSPMNLAGVSLAGPYGLTVCMPNVANIEKDKVKDTDGKKATGSKDGSEAISENGDDDSKAKSPPQEQVDAEGNIIVTDSDVIAGRGGRSNHHPGNKRFRDIVSLHRPDYVRAAKIHKPGVARMIVHALRNSDPPARFLRKDEKTGKWYDIGDKKAAEKASQALREKTPEERDVSKQEAVNGMPLSYLSNPALFDATSAMINAALPGLAAMPVAAVPGAATGAAGAGAAMPAEANDSAKEAEVEKPKENATKEKAGKKTEYGV